MYSLEQFKLVSKYQPTGDQPQAIERLVQGVKNGDKEQTLMGVTGSGKTFTMANIIAKLNRPTLVLAHNKTLAAQLCSEFKEFFPENAVEYFVSYYDYYQPEAYIPTTDTYIEKDSAVNDEIDKLRHSATSALSERRDVIIVASVSCIYTLGDPIDYRSMVISLRPGMEKSRDELIAKLTLDDGQYEKGISGALAKSKKFAAGAGKAFRGVAGAVTKIGLAAAGAAETGVVALTKKSIDAYAEYEQLVGGVETLFKQSQSKVLAYAESAYTTAGLSANEYMDTVTSFSASLLASLGGDTEKAADVANRAITDMSDNANKMGTDMSFIQNAYMSFSRGQYQLLDNLKLGKQKNMPLAA